jgi:N-acetyl-1-D-myo-inositol-2-amino-2-deoxy-alpha-D-glucopyranoside deacetylase
MTRGDRVLRWYGAGVLTAVVGVCLATCVGAIEPVPDLALPTPRPPSARRPLAEPLVLPREPRVIVFAPHPDDETVAVGGLLARLARRRLPVRVVYMTNGDGYPLAVEERLDVEKPTDADYRAYGTLRQREAIAAARRLGLGRGDLSFLGFPDGGLAELWRAHWAEPFTSPYTKETSPPYPDAVSPDAEYEGKDLTSVITRLLRDFRPTVVIMPHPYDRHPDHVHTSYFVTEAVSNLQAKGVLSPGLQVLTYLVHFPSWPAVRPPTFDRCLTVSELADTLWTDTETAPEDLAAKRAALAEYRTQLEVMNGFLQRFLCRNELLAAVDHQLLARIAKVH